MTTSWGDLGDGMQCLQKAYVHKRVLEEASIPTSKLVLHVEPARGNNCISYNNIHSPTQSPNGEFVHLNDPLL
jgi:hypothetical protein